MPKQHVTLSIGSSFLLGCGQSRLFLFLRQIIDKISVSRPGASIDVSEMPDSVYELGKHQKQLTYAFVEYKRSPPIMADNNLVLMQ